MRHGDEQRVLRVVLLKVVDNAAEKEHADHDVEQVDAELLDALLERVNEHVEALGAAQKLEQEQAAQHGRNVLDADHGGLVGQRQVEIVGQDERQVDVVEELEEEARLVRTHQEAHAELDREHDHAAQLHVVEDRVGRRVLHGRQCVQYRIEQRHQDQHVVDHCVHLCK